MLTQHRHDADWDKADKQDFEKKKLAELKKTHSHLSLPRLHRVIMQRKKIAKVEHIGVVSLKISIICCANVNNAIFSLSPSTDMMLTGIKQINKILKIKAGRTEEEPAKTPSHHHAEKEEDQGGAN